MVMVIARSIATIVMLTIMMEVMLSTRVLLIGVYDGDNSAMPVNGETM